MRGEYARVPMNVGLVSHSAELGGAERSLLETAIRLRASGVHPHVVLPRNGPLLKQLQRESFVVGIFPYRWWASRQAVGRPRRFARSLLTRAAALPLSRYFTERGCRVVVSNSEVSPAGALAAIRMNVPHVWCLREIWQGWQFDDERMAAEIMRPCANVFVANSEATKVSHRSHLGDAQIKVVPPSIRVPALQPERVGDGLRCLMLGTKIPTKRHADVLRAIQLCARAGAKVGLRIVGPESASVAGYGDDLLRQAHALGLESVVELLGATAADEAFANANVLVVASCEGYGRTIVEAMHAGIPVVAADCGAAREHIVHGEDGLLFEPEDSKSLAEQLLQLSKNPTLQGQIRKRARAKAVHRRDPAEDFAALLRVQAQALN